MMKHSPQSLFVGWALYKRANGELFQWSSGPPIFKTRKEAQRVATEFETTWGGAYYVQQVRVTPKGM